MRRVLVVVLIFAFVASCTRAGRVCGGFALAHVGTGTALLVKGDDDGGRTAGGIMIGLGAYFLLGAIVAEVVGDARHEVPRGGETGGAFVTAGDGAAETSSDGSGERAVPADREAAGSGRHGVPYVGERVDLQCAFGDCTKHGTTGRTGAGSVETRCSFGDCTKHGWTTSSSDGARSDTQCSFGDCNQHGWTTSSSDGSRSDSRCSFGDCTKHGWSTTSSDGTRTESRCNFGDCNTHGWTSVSTDGRRVECRCKFGDCNTHGVECQ